LQLLKTLPLAGVVITGDAIITEKEVCRVIIDGGGNYLFTVKGNQPGLKSDISRRQATVRPVSVLVLVLVLAISWMMTSGLPRQFWVMNENNLCCRVARGNLTPGRS